MLADDAGVELYIDICTPAVWNERGARTIDLDLDIVVWAPARGGHVELVDEDEDVSAFAGEAGARDAVSRRTVPATIAGARRMMQLVEVPLGTSGVAGYAIDVEDQEEARAELARFVRAQRDMLDRLSAGVAQFGRDRSLIEELFGNIGAVGSGAMPGGGTGPTP
ncbi:MAG: DUF402 domain-containing protein, partial [Actinomycetes bacterium]